MNRFLESLEGRALCAASIVQSGTELAIVGSNVQIYTDGDATSNTVTVLDRSTPTPTQTVFSGITAISLTGTSRVDILSVSNFADVNFTVNGGKGNDDILFSNNANGIVTIDARSGTDAVRVSGSGLDVHVLTGSRTRVTGSNYYLN